MLHIIIRCVFIYCIFWAVFVLYGFVWDLGKIWLKTKIVLLDHYKICTDLVYKFLIPFFNFNNWYILIKKIHLFFNFFSWVFFFKKKKKKKPIMYILRKCGMPPFIPYIIECSICCVISRYLLFSTLIYILALF